MCLPCLMPECFGLVSSLFGQFLDCNCGGKFAET